MKEFKYVITDPEGIHARPAGELVKAAKEFAANITLTKDGKSGDCKRIFGIMGLAFITEGAIPFAASDPVHVLPACIVGSGVAGAMSMLFNCTLMAPHGGIFVFPVMGNPLFYLLALVVGMAISTVLLGVLKKNVEE